MDKHKILIVDDDSIALAIAKAMLENDYEVTLAKSGREGLGYLRDKRLPDLILVDMVMPGVGGVEFMQAIKEFDPPLLMPVILMTSVNNIQEVGTTYHSGASDYITKPLDEGVLRSKVRLHLRYYDLEKENLQLKNAIRQTRQLFNSLFPD